MDCLEKLTRWRLDVDPEWDEEDFMCKGKKIRTVKTLRKLLKHPRARRRWSLARRKAVFGLTEKAVRNQLVKHTFCGTTRWVHKKIVRSLERVEARIRAAEKANGYPKWVPEDLQCFNWRQSAAGGLSRHAHACALDIHPAANGVFPRYTGRDDQATDIPARVFNAFLAEGWGVGVEWDQPLDVMHVEYC